MVIRTNDVPLIKYMIDTAFDYKDYKRGEHFNLSLDYLLYDIIKYGTKEQWDAYFKYTSAKHINDSDENKLDLKEEDEDNFEESDEESDEENDEEDENKEFNYIISEHIKHLDDGLEAAAFTNNEELFDRIWTMIKKDHEYGPELGFLVKGCYRGMKNGNVTRNKNIMRSILQIVKEQGFEFFGYVTIKNFMTYALNGDFSDILEEAFEDLQNDIDGDVLSHCKGCSKVGADFLLSKGFTPENLLIQLINNAFYQPLDVFEYLLEKVTAENNNWELLRRIFRSGTKTLFTPQKNKKLTTNDFRWLLMDFEIANHYTHTKKQKARYIQMVILFAIKLKLISPTIVEKFTNEAQSKWKTPKK